MTYKIYIVYPFKQKEVINELLEAVAEYDNTKDKNDKNIELFYFEKKDSYVISSDGTKYDLTDDTWKEKAKEKINTADLVAVFMYADELNSNNENIYFEYSYAKSIGKKVIPIKKDTKQLSQDVINKFFKEEAYGKVDDKRETFSENMITNKAKFAVKDSLLINDSSDLENKNKELYYNLLMEQYKIMIDSSESLIDRRQSMSNLYTGICTTLVTLLGSSFALNNKYGTSITFILVGIVVAMLSLTWISQLKTYNKTNYGKYEVINAIEAKLPADMFNNEYMFNKSKKIKSYSERESLLPKMFIVISSIIEITGILLIFLL